MDFLVTFSIALHLHPNESDNEHDPKQACPEVYNKQFLQGYKLSFSSVK